MSAPLDERIERAFDAMEDGDAESALALAREALDIAPDDPDANHLAGAALIELGDPEAALPFLRQAAESDPENVDALVTLGTALLDLLRYPEARDALAAALKVDAGFADAHWWAGLVAERLGEAEEAKRFLAKAISLGYPAPHEVSEEAFRGMVEEAIAKLPADFQESLQNLAIVVEPFPRDEVLAGSPPLPPTILGLQTGTPRDERSISDAMSAMPNVIFLFQKNIERAAATREDLLEQIEITLQHEIGHYLGLDEDEVAERGLE